MAGGIVSEPLNPHNSFNWVFLVELLICGILTVFFLFYFNRLFATLVSYAIRAYTWRTFGAYVDIQALQISLLGGRIFFKDIRYHGHNETILIHGGYITWRYWLRRVREPGLHSIEESDRTARAKDHGPQSSSNGNLDGAEKGGVQSQKRLPCRITVKVSGVEAFMYNRSPAYDGIIEAMNRNSNDAAQKVQSNTTTGSNPVRAPTVAPLDDTSVTGSKHHIRLRKNHTHDKAVDPSTDDGAVRNSLLPNPEPPAFLRLLPIQIDCTKGAIVVGNENTSAVITAQFEKARGEIDASAAGPLDIYQQIFRFEFTHPVVYMKPNPDFKSSQLETAAYLKQEAGQHALDKSEHVQNNQPSEKRRSWPLRLSGLSGLSGLFSRSQESINAHPKGHGGRGGRKATYRMQLPGQDRWKGLTRYLDEDENDGHGEWDAIDYAKTSLIADCPSINVSFYWDIPGHVDNEVDEGVDLQRALKGDINGSLPPDYGMDIQIFGGTVNYGPWADRHRATFQSFFFPGSHVDAIPASPLRPGDTRVLTLFKVYVSIEQDVVLRIPLREPSKDWKWKGKASAMTGSGTKGADKNRTKQKGRRKAGGKQREETASTPNVRPFGWIDIKVAGKSSVIYAMDMVASDKGFRSRLDVGISSTEISSSVNHGLLWRSGDIAMDCDLSTPVGWNHLRKWAFNVLCKDLDLFLLRDHLFLLTDLVLDWGSGPPADYFTFVPFQYRLNVDFERFKLYLNTNDANIVNNPSDLDDNTFITLYGQKLNGKVTIPLDRFRTRQNEIKFDVFGQEIGMDLCMPPKNTLYTFVSSKTVANLGSVTLGGSHTYLADTSAMNTDRLYMNIRGNKLSLELYGFLVHHFMKIKDNYFGEHMHFKTLEEFQGLPSQNLAVDGPVASVQPNKVTNDLDVILSIAMVDGSVFLPGNLYSAERSLRFDVPYAATDLRFTNYYMDLMVDFSPLSLSRGASMLKRDLPNEFTSQTEVFLDSLTIYGHRLFGLPPTEPTYVCNWDFKVGTLSGECTTDFVDDAVSAIRSFAFTFDDDENAVPITNLPVIHDVTFLRLKTGSLHVWLHVAEEAILLESGPISLDFNDLAGQTFSQRLQTLIPDLTMSIVDARSASRHRTREGEKQTIETFAFLQTSVSLNMLRRKLHFAHDRSKQQAHMHEEDQRTNRASFLFLSSQERDNNSTINTHSKVKPPAMQFPEIPHPVFLSGPSEVVDHSSVSPAPSFLSSPSVKRRPHASGSSSTSSLAESIRNGYHGYSSRQRQRMPKTKAPFLSSGHPRVTPDQQERRRRNLPPSSVALTSPLITPYFPLLMVEPDLSEVPDLPTVSQVDQVSDDKAALFNGLSTEHLDESFDHTSLLIDFEPGIRAFCTPRAVICISRLMDRIEPERPEDLLDAFQVDVVTKLLDKQKRREGKGKSTEFSVQIPFIHARFVNAFDKQLIRDVVLEKDQYDLTLQRLKLAARVKNFAGQQTGESTLSLHTSLQSCRISVSEQSVGVPQDDVAVHAEITDFLIWALKAGSTSVNVSFRDLEVATASQKIEYLASFIHRTTLLGDDLAAGFKALGPKRQKRLQSLAWLLSSQKQQLPDPAFLARPSYALRAARQHLRNDDSWKIISRFRFIWRSLPDDEKGKLRDRCARSSSSYPHDAEERVISLWNQWRTWDLSHVRNSLAMRTIYACETANTETLAAGPVYLDLKCGGLKFIVDPGPKQSEAALAIVATKMAIAPPPPPAGLMLVRAEDTAQSITVQANSQKSTLSLNWEICELLENLMRMFQADDDRQAPARTVQRPSVVAKSGGRNLNFEFLYATESAELTLDTINLRSVSIGRQLRVSVGGSENKGSNRSETVTALVHLEQGMTEVFCRSRSLLQSQFDFPSLYFSRTVQHNTERSDDIKVAGISRMIKLQVTEDIIGVIEAVDSVIRDEVAYISHLSSPPPRLQKAKTIDSSTSTTKLPNLTMALLMDSYLVEIALLQSLTWSIVGSSGRISVVPSLGPQMGFKVDYDLDGHVHRMYSIASGEPNSIAALELPALNGVVQLRSTKKRISIFASGIIDTVRLQASEVQALIATVNRPEITNMTKVIQEDIIVVKRHIKEIFPSVSQAGSMEPQAPGRDLVFKMQTTFSGLHILASTPGQFPDSTMANLTFKLGSIQLNATNISQDDTVMILPEVMVQLQQLSVEMTLADHDVPRQCGNLTFAASFQATSQPNPDGRRRLFRLLCSELEINIHAETASAVVDVLNHLQDKIKDLDLSKEKKYLRKLRHTRSRPLAKKAETDSNAEADCDESGGLFSSAFAVELANIQISWIVGNSPIPPYPGTESEDLVLSFRKIDLATTKDEAARLIIEDMQLQMVPESGDKKKRSLNSALMPEVLFNVAYASTKDTRRLVFLARGKSLDVRLDSRFILPANVLERSISLAGEKFRAASASWNVAPTASGNQRKAVFGNKRLASCLVDADFAGAVVHLQGNTSIVSTESGSPQKLRYNRFVGDASASSTSLHAPRVALRVEYKDDGTDPSLNAEMKIDASSNILYPTVVPLIIDISNSIKEVVRETDEATSPERENQPKPAAKLLDEDNLLTADPSAILGKTRLNIGLRICKQEFSLSCQPIARVAAVAKLEDIYVTVNSVKSQEHGHFFAASATFENLQASVQHVYSRESTFGFDVDSIVLSLMNSKHLSGTSGISAILKVNPTRLQVNARQLQDFLLFREIWLPPEIRQASQSKPPPANTTADQPEYLLQRYQQVAAATAFPWNANVSITNISVDLDLGQAIGRTALNISNLWASSRKSTTWEQNLCIGVERIGIESTGRTSGFVELSGVKVRTSISWLSPLAGVRQTPLIQASVGFRRLRVKAGFDYQAFVIADISDFDFLMYNVRDQSQGSGDRLVAALDGDKVHVFCTATSAAQGLALYQALERLVQENQQAYAHSLKDIEKFLRRRSSATTRTPSQSQILNKPDDDSFKTPISLHTDVVVTLRSTRLGVFPATFVDSQLFLLEASETQARFAVALEDDKIHSGLGMTLGQLSVALAAVSQSKTGTGKSVADLTVDDVLESAASARGGTILRVPKVVATMHTWQQAGGVHIDYVFKSAFEGKVDVGWNYSRISYIRNMFSNHSRSLASRLGKPLPESAVVKITRSAAPERASPEGGAAAGGEQQGTADELAGGKTPQEREKITAVVNVPLSKYEYTALEPPIIETPQLRDMGEATPPLEWIGLHRDRLPNVTHQIVIVTLLEVAKEVEDAYGRILGSS